MPRRRPLSHYLRELQGRGVQSFETAEAAQWAGTSPVGILPSLKRLADKRLIVSPARGLYVIVPPQHLAWGAPPAAWFIDPWMAHLGRRYYVALLSAAQFLGAAHQAPQVFQVAVDRRTADRVIGRSDVRFFVNPRIDKVPAIKRNVPTGQVDVSTGEVTALDLVARPLAAGGLSNVATVLIQLADTDQIRDQRLMALERVYSASVVRRAGFLLETFADMHLESLHEAVSAHTSSVVELQAGGARRGPVDPRWRVRVNAKVEPDA